MLDIAQSVLSFSKIESLSLMSVGSRFRQIPSLPMMIITLTSQQLLLLVKQA
jgi:hypothetical protein